MNSPPTDRERIDAHVNELVNASILRSMAVVVSEEKDEEQVRRKILRYFFVGIVLVVVLIVGIAHLRYPQIKSSPAKEGNERSTKTFISANSPNVVLATYYRSVIQRLHSKGNEYLSGNDDKSRYGEAIVSIPIRQDGSIYEQDGGAEIEKKSGNEKMNETVLVIVRQAVPYPTFKANGSSPADGQVRVIYTRMQITKDKVKK